MSKGIGALIVSASDPDLQESASSILHGIILDCIRLTTPPPPPSPPPTALGEHQLSTAGMPYGFSDLNISPSSEAATSVAATAAVGAASAAAPAVVAPVAPGVGAADMAAMQVEPLHHYLL